MNEGGGIICTLLYQSPTVLKIRTSTPANAEINGLKTDCGVSSQYNPCKVPITNMKLLYFSVGLELVA